MAARRRLQGISIGTLLILTIALLVGSSSVWARRVRSPSRACRANLRQISGAMEMFCLDHNLVHDDLRKLGDGIIPRLIEEGYLQVVPVCIHESADGKDTYRIVEVEESWFAAFCTIHGFGDHDTFSGVSSDVSPREQLIERGITDPTLRAEAYAWVASDRHRRRLWPDMLFQPNVYFWEILMIVVLLTFIGDILICLWTWFVPTDAATCDTSTLDRLRGLFRVVFILFLLFFAYIVFGLRPIEALRRGDWEGITILAVLLAVVSILGWLSGRLMARRVAANGGGPSSVYRCYALIGAALGRHLLLGPFFLRPMFDDKVYLMLLFAALSARTWTARRRLSLVEQREHKPAPIGLQGLSASPSRPTRGTPVIIIMLSIGLLAGASPVWATRSRPKFRACKATLMTLNRALEMYARDNDLSQHDLQDMNEDVFPRLVEAGHLNHFPSRCPLAEHKETGWYRLVDGEVFCTRHGFFPSDDFGIISARQKLRQRGVTDPALLAEAKSELPRDSYGVVPLRALRYHGIWLDLGLLAVAVGLVLFGELIVYDQTGHVPKISAETSARMQRHLTRLLYGTVLFLILSFIAVGAEMAPLMDDFLEYNETLAFMTKLVLVAGAVGWVSGRMLGRRIAALGGGFFSLIDSYVLYFLIVTAVVLSWIPSFGRHIPLAMGQDIMALILLAFAARLWTARGTLNEG